MMQPAQDRKAKNVTDGSNGARYRGIVLSENPIRPGFAS
jgi:hypothetical protein